MDACPKKPTQNTSRLLISAEIFFQGQMVIHDKSAKIHFYTRASIACD